MDTTQARLQQRVDALSERILFLQEMYQSWKNLKRLPLSPEDRAAYQAFLHHESLSFRQALQRVRQDLRRERKLLREDMLPFSEKHC